MSATSTDAQTEGEELQAPLVVFICTGNAARSVMAGAAVATRVPHVRVATAGTLVVEGQPMSHRTRTALRTVGLEPPPHKSRQATERHLGEAVLVVGLAPEHIEWVRRTVPGVADRAGTLKRLCRELPATTGPLAERVASLHLDEVDLEPWEEVVDPGGSETDVFIACAREVIELADRFSAALEG